MLFTSKNGPIVNSRSRTPQKMATPLYTPSSKQAKKEANRYESIQKDKNKENTNIKYKTKDSYQILQNL